MKKLIHILPLAVLVVSTTTAQRIHTRFDASWKFHRGDVSHARTEIKEPVLQLVAYMVRYFNRNLRG